VASDRRLVPMPQPRKPVSKPSLSKPPTVPPLQVQQPWLQPGSKLRPSTLKEDAPYIWAFIALCAVWYWLNPLFYLGLFIALFALFVRGWLWLSFRFPLTMYFINLLLATLIRGGRR
jgi:hypothetical protein